MNAENILSGPEGIEMFDSLKDSGDLDKSSFSDAVRRKARAL